MAEMVNKPKVRRLSAAVWHRLGIPQTPSPAPVHRKSLSILGDAGLIKLWSRTLLPDDYCRTHRPCRAVIY